MTKVEFSEKVYSHRIKWRLERGGGEMNVRKSMTNKMISGFCSTYMYYVSITST